MQAQVIQTKWLYPKHPHVNKFFDLVTLTYDLGPWLSNFFDISSRSTTIMLCRFLCPYVKWFVCESPARLTTSHSAPYRWWSITYRKNGHMHCLISTKLQCASPKYALVQNNIMNLDWGPGLGGLFPAFRRKICFFWHSAEFSSSFRDSKMAISGFRPHFLYFSRFCRTFWVLFRLSAKSILSPLDLYEPCELPKYHNMCQVFVHHLSMFTEPTWKWGNLL